MTRSIVAIVLTLTTACTGDSSTVDSSPSTMDSGYQAMAYADSDGDGLSNLEELALGTDLYNPDTDGDGWSDGEEVEANTDPLDPDSHP